MKVGTLTMQRTMNYGAQIQAYALRKAICEMGHDCSVVNYLCPAVENRESPYTRKKITGFHSLVKWANTKAFGKRSYAEFERFRREKCGIESSLVDHDNLDAACQHFDAIVVGSDQVWNTNITGGDLGYFLDNVSDGPRKISYAASLGTGRLSDEYREKCIGLVQEFDAVSVRESSSSEYFKMNGLEKACPVVLDPTLLVENSVLDALCSKPLLSPGYVLLYMVSEQENSRAFARRLAKSSQVPLVVLCISGTVPVFGAKNIHAASPECFLSIIKHAGTVVTSSFHGICLSISFEKDFYYFINESSGRSERITDLACRFGLDDRSGSMSTDLSMGPIDFTPVRKRLAAEREASWAFLANALEG